MRLLWLRVFQEVALAGSLGEAARNLGYTQSAVSRHIAALEAEYRVPLLVRGPGGAEITEYGERLLRRADAILTHDTELRGEIDGLRKGITGRLVVGAFPTAVAGLLPQAVATFREAVPDADLSLLEATTPVLLERLPELDVAVITDGPDVPAGRTRTHLLDEPLLIAVGRNHRLARRRSVQLREVAGETFLTGSATDENVILRAQHLTGFAPAKRIVVADWIGKFACIAAGLGVALVPELVTRAAPSGITFLRLRDEHPPYRRVVALTDPTHQPSALAKTFVRLLT
ncbi:MAG: LysR family transcriptional regulator [Kribbellaceae bacterium]|nr:LysR family transcriptional regulator [Kribbellaceae bacterium]